MTTTTPYGLDVRAEHRVHSDAERTWDALLDLASWWPPCWEDGAHLEFEPRVGGRLGTVHGGGGALWGVVTALRPGRELAVDGTMGIPGPVAGQWRMRLEPEGPTTLVTVEHRVLGPVDDDDREGFTTRWPETLAALAAAAAR